MTDVSLGGALSGVFAREHVATAVAVAASVRVRDAFARETFAAGVTGLGASERAVDVETPFDLASVTKTVTALALARVVRRGALEWATPLGEVVDEARGTPSATVPVELFVAHRAGLEPHVALWDEASSRLRASRSEALAIVARARRGGCEGAPPAEGFAPAYSDLGYVLAAEAGARASGVSVERMLRDEVLDPLGLRLGSAAWWRARDASFSARVAATEATVARGVVRGEVHDENAWAFGGLEACGHAGLFGAAPALAALGEAVLDVFAGRRDEWLTPAELDVLVRPRPGGTLRAGFDAKSSEGSSAGVRFGPRSVGHLGFTGTSLWVDPERELAAALLTNRVHPSRSADAIRRARPAVHDAVAEWADARRRA